MVLQQQVGTMLVGTKHIVSASLLLMYCSCSGKDGAGVEP
jgi:hypothetical protein